MVKKAKIEAPENKTLGLEMQHKAVVLAQAINDPLMVDLETINKAREDWEGGAFTVMHRLASIMTKEQRDSLPDPKSDSGNNPAYYLVPITKISPKGKRSEEWKQRYYYSDLAINLPGIVAKVQLKSQIERSLGSDDVNKTDIPEHILNMTIAYRESLARKLNNQINSAERAVTQAFELFFQLKKFYELKHVDAVPSFEIGPDGMPLDGSGGKPMQVVDSKVPIVIKSTIKGREDIDKKAVSIGTFLKYDLAKAAEENGGTFQSVMNTVKREKPEEQSGHNGGTGNAGDQSRPQSVNTAETANARAMDIYVFIDAAIKEKDRANWDKLKKSLQGEDNNEDFMAWRGLLHYAKLLVGSPADDKRYRELTEDMGEDEKLVA